MKINPDRFQKNARQTRKRGFIAWRLLNFCHLCWQQNKQIMSWKTHPKIGIIMNRMSMLVLEGFVLVVSVLSIYIGRCFFWKLNKRLFLTSSNPSPECKKLLEVSVATADEISKTINCDVLKQRIPKKVVEYLSLNKWQERMFISHAALIHFLCPETTEQKAVITVDDMKICRVENNNDERKT